MNNGTGPGSHVVLSNTEMTEDNMPILLWFLGVPLSLILVLMLFGAF